MRMGINIRRFSVGCPAGMSDAAMSLRLSVNSHFIYQIGKTAFAFFNLNRTFFKHGNSCRVITSIFQLGQCIYQYVRTIPVTYIANNSTHCFQSFLLLIIFRRLIKHHDQLSLIVESHYCLCSSSYKAFEFIHIFL